MTHVYHGDEDDHVEPSVVLGRRPAPDPGDEVKRVMELRDRGFRQVAAGAHQGGALFSAEAQPALRPQLQGVEAPPVAKAQVPKGTTTDDSFSYDSDRVASQVGIRTPRRIPLKAPKLKGAHYGRSLLGLPSWVQVLALADLRLRKIEEVVADCMLDPHADEEQALLAKALRRGARALRDAAEVLEDGNRI